MRCRCREGARDPRGRPCRIHQDPRDGQLDGPAAHRCRPGRRERGAARMTGDLDGVRALVTGASKGIGVAICERLAAEGARVVVSGRDRTSLDQLVERLREAHHAETVCLPADLADPLAVTPLADAAWEAFDGLDLLVNNAGMSITG